MSERDGRKNRRWSWNCLIWESRFFVPQAAAGQDVYIAALGVTGKNHRIGGSWRKSSLILPLLII